MYKPHDWIKNALVTYQTMLCDCSPDWAFMELCEGHELSTEEQYELAAAIDAAHLPLPCEDAIRRGYC